MRRRAAFKLVLVLAAWVSAVALAGDASACDSFGVEAGDFYQRVATSLDGRALDGSSLYAPANLRVAGDGHLDAFGLHLLSRVCNLRIGVEGSIGFLSDVGVSSSPSFARDLSFSIAPRGASLGLLGGVVGYAWPVGMVEPHLDLVGGAGFADLQIARTSRVAGDLAGRLDRSITMPYAAVRAGTRVVFFDLVGLDFTGMVSPFGATRAGFLVSLVFSGQGRAARSPTEGEVTSKAVAF